MYQRITEIFNKSDKEALLVELKPLILSSIKKYYPDYENYDDLIQEGYVVVLTVFDKEDLESAKHFLGYVKNALRFHYLNKHKIKREEVSLNTPVKNGEGLELLDTLEDGTLSIEDSLNQEEDLRELKNSLDMLSKRQREVVIGFYIEEKSIQALADKLKVSYRTVVNTKTIALEKLKKNKNFY